MNESQCKGILIKMEYRNQQIPNNTNEIKQIAIEHSIKLIEKWIECKAIGSIKSHDGSLKYNDFECFDD